VNELLIFTAVAIGSLLAGVRLHTAGWVGLNLLMLPFIGTTGIATWRWRQRTVSRTPLVPADAA
jgi:hypothetical protein